MYSWVGAGRSATATTAPATALAGELSFIVPGAVTLKCDFIFGRFSRSFESRDLETWNHTQGFYTDKNRLGILIEVSVVFMVSGKWGVGG